ncbi:uncharacterized protein V1510DRAFT_414492 [Dipodascopsis tothii]|uniref:uncharacterized protein n=1 Tax=Dipodascopsis tothii TaxID=44089 RepID=UPI0034CFED1B
MIFSMAWSICSRPDRRMSLTAECPDAMDSRRLDAAEKPDMPDALDSRFWCSECRTLCVPDETMLDRFESRPVGTAGKSDDRMSFQTPESRAPGSPGLRRLRAAGLSVLLERDGRPEPVVDADAVDEAETGLVGDVADADDARDGCSGDVTVVVVAVAVAVAVTVVVVVVTGASAPASGGTDAAAMVDAVWLAVDEIDERMAARSSVARGVRGVPGMPGSRDTCAADSADVGRTFGAAELGSRPSAGS